VIYGKDSPVHISLDAKDFTNKLKHFSESTLLKLSVGEASHRVFVKDYQENVMRGQITHVDFFEVTTGELLRTRVTIVLKGSPAGARFGGVLEQSIHEVEVECFPRNLPESIVVDVTSLGINETIHVGNMTLPEGVKVLTPADVSVASVKGVKDTVSAPVEADASESAATTESK
jgi:large subunit ribosomal protein L25